jgi:ribosomal protein S18 acetylase RimI-like enzyme
MLELRTATAGDVRDIAALHIASWQSAYRGVVPDHILNSRSLEGSANGWTSTIQLFPGNVVVAQDARSILGFCCSGPVVNVERSGPSEYEFYGLHVAPGHHRLGIGSALMNNGFARMKALGLEGAIVWTLKDLGQSRRFYEKLGGRVAKEDKWIIDDVALDEVAYSW